MTESESIYWQRQSERTIRYEMEKRLIKRGWLDVNGQPKDPRPDQPVHLTAP